MAKSLLVNLNSNKYYNIREKQTLTGQDEEQSNVLPTQRKYGKLHKGKLDLGGNH